MRLEGAAVKGAVYVAVVFQFHFGAIRRIGSVPELLQMPLFQFHFGAIRSSVGGNVARWAHAFQFHFGAIRSIW